MDRRTVLAIGLMLIVALLPSILFPPTPTPGPPAGADTVTAAVPTADSAIAPSPVPAAAPPPPAPAAAPREAAPEAVVTVSSPLYEYGFSTTGARLARASLLEYRTFATDSAGVLQLIPSDSRFFTYAVVVGSDTVSFADWRFEPSDSSVTVPADGATLEMVGRRGRLEIRLRYRFRPDEYHFRVEGELGGVGPSGLVLVSLGPQLAEVEADSEEDARARGIITKAAKTQNLAIRSLDPLERRELGGPFEWVAWKSKYFLAAVLTTDQDVPRFGGAVVVGAPGEGKDATAADVVVSLPAPAGQFEHSVYVGPQEFRRLARIGHDFEDVNPYGWIFRPIIRPFANLIVRVLLWMHETLSLGYGWVLILFGLAVRVVLWPLNQKAMRSSMAMQAIQPQLKAIQERYKQEPQRLQQEMMKLYREHKVNPLGGCLPMLLPMPVLFALFFVFRETIEFRGVPFLWLPDLSRHDPIYIIPIVMGLSMFAVMRIGQAGMAANPQAKMMMYMMPPFLTFIFLRLSSGLNLYYAVSNIASIPQQWLIARERDRRGKAAPPSD